MTMTELPVTESNDDTPATSGSVVPVRQFGDDEVTRILQKAAELQEQSVTHSHGSPGGLTLAELREVALEAGDAGIHVLEVFFHKIRAHPIPEGHKQLAPVRHKVHGLRARDHRVVGPGGVGAKAQGRLPVDRHGRSGRRRM